MEELNLENILGIDEIDNLFMEDGETQETPPEEKEKKENETTEVSVDDLFTKEPESVGSEDSEDNIEDEEDADNTKEKGTSPKNNFYSSIAQALKDEGIFPDLDDDIINKATTPEDFRDLIDSQIKAGIEERQKRIDEALGYGVEPSEIRKYENALNYLDSITEDIINDESDNGEKLRKQLIYQDFINRGYSKERAEREVNKSFNSGSDIEDAKEALASNKEFFKDAYNDLIREAKEEEEKAKQERKNRAEKLKKSLLEDKEVFGEITLDKSTRQRVYDNISKPIYKDPDTGELLTAVQKYERDNSTEFLKNVGLLFSLTDGFKNLDKLVKGKVRKEVKKGLRELESTINSTSRTSDGNLRFTSGVGDDLESSARGWDFDS
jgi:hypothetical protein